MSEAIVGRPLSHVGRQGSGTSRATTPKTPSGDRLTPMPDYMHPVMKSASSRWKKLHEDHMMMKLIEKRNEKKELNRKTKEEAQRLARKIPMEILAKQWLKDNRATADTRAYLVDKILPTLIVGVEKLLMEVGRRGLAELNELDNDFNPVNYLAQYLMRNNPKYSNFSEASPYIRGLREVSEELQKQLYDIEENKLARIKSEARRKREEREQAELRRQMEITRRLESLEKQFDEWIINKYEDTKVELALVQNSLRSFAEISEHYPEQLRKAAKLSHELEPTDDTGRTLTLKEFVKYMSQFIENMPAEVFDQFVRHLTLCAASYRAATEREERRVVLTQVFVACDATGVGLLDRHRVLNLFEMFYDKTKETIRSTLRNPRKWPVVDVQEIDTESGSDDEDEASSQDQAPRFFDNNFDVTPRSKESEDNEEVKQSEQPLLERAAEGMEEEKTTEGTAEEQGDKSEREESEKVDTNNVDQDAQHIDGDITYKNDAREKVEEKTDAADQDADVKPTADNEKDKEGTIDKASGEATSENVEQDAAAIAAAEDADDEAEKGEKDISEKEKVADDPQELLPTSGIPKSGDDRDPELTRLSEGDETSPAHPPMTQQSKVSFAEGTTFQRERSLVQSRGSLSQSQASAFDENTVNVSQFVQVLETFLGDEPNMEAFNQLVTFIKGGYQETEDERMQRFIKARQEAHTVKRKALLNSLFEIWDNDGSGYLDLDEVETIMKKYKDGLENKAINTAIKEFKKKTRNRETRLGKREFRSLVHRVVELMAGADVFDYFIEFLLNSVERTYAERVRGEARKKWIQLIVAAGETGGVNMEPVYKTVFQALYKDAEAHGNSKLISAYIAMLERNEVAPSRGDFLLRYVAATPDCAPYVLGKALFKDMRGISFASVDSGKPIHVPRVSNHGNIHFWNTDRPDEEKDGSFIVVPLKDRRKRVFGLLGVDTLNDPHSRAIFITHEIQFFQGIAKAFSIAYHLVDVRQKTIRISESAVSWIHRRSPNVREIVVYMVEPDGKNSDYVLRRMMNTNDKGSPNILKKPPRLERKDNLFRDYLFKCVDNSESITADAYGERHLAIPLRNDEGMAIVVIDISIGDLKLLPKSESRDVMKMLKLLQMAYTEIARESKSGGGGVEDDASADILFDRLMLKELQENVSKLDQKAYAELKSYNDPPQIIHQIIRSVLSIFYPEKANQGEFDNWSQCKQYMTPNLSQTIVTYDPTSDETDPDAIPVELIQGYLSDVPHGQVNKHGSIPAQYLYNWVFVCVSLIEHNRKVRRGKRKDMSDQEMDAVPKKQTTEVGLKSEDDGTDTKPDLDDSRSDM